MVWSYLADAKDWAVDQAVTTVGNVWDSTEQTYDVARGAEDEFNNITRRQLLESTAAAFLGYETAKEVPDAASELDPEVQWKFGPLGKVPQNDGNSGNENTVSDNGKKGTQTEEGIVKDYESFVRGLKNQDSESLDYVEDGLNQDPGLVNQASVESGGLYVDSTLIEWDDSDMDESMEEYLRQADQDGDLAKWLSRYEKENL